MMNLTNSNLPLNIGLNFNKKLPETTFDINQNINIMNNNLFQPYFSYLNFSNLSSYMSANNNIYQQKTFFNQINNSPIIPNINLNNNNSSITVEYIDNNKKTNKIKKKYKPNKKKEKKEIIVKIQFSNIKPENIINIPLILLGKEKRTFLRLHPIPKQFSVYDMIRIIDKHLKTKPGKRIYNAVYLPQTKVIRKNMGYFFINLVSPKYVIEFYNIFNNFYFRFKNSKKQCTIIFSDHQEIDTSNDDPSRRPIIFYDTVKDDNNE